MTLRSAAVGSRRRTIGALPSLPADAGPARVLADAGAAGACVLTVTGTSGSGKSVWLRQLGDAAAAPASLRWRVVAVGAGPGDHDTPYATARRLVRAAAPRTVTATDASPSLPTMRRTLHGALRRGLSSRRRLLLVVDDVQWIDDESARVLRLICEDLARGDAVVVLAGRAPRTGAVAASIVAAAPDLWRLTREIAVEPLDASGLRAYASRTHGIEVSLELAERLRRFSGGVPLLVDRVIESLAPRWEERTRTPIARRARFDEDITDEVIARGFAADDAFAALRTQVPEPARAVTDAGAALPGADAAAQHRALLRTLDAEHHRDADVDEPLWGTVRDAMREGAAVGRAEWVFQIARRAIELADRHAPGRADELVLELYALSTRMSALPRMIEWIPRLQRAPSGPLRDLALLHVREFRGDYGWARDFAAGLLDRLPTHRRGAAGAASDDGPTAGADELSALIVRMHVLVVLGVLAPQASPGDYGLDELAQARELALHMIHVQASDSARWSRIDPVLRVLPSPHDALLRSIGMTLFGLSALGHDDRVRFEIAALGEAIDAAPVDTPTVFDSRLIRAGVFSSVGLIHAAASDLSVCMRMLRAGTAGWGSGTARAMHVYCQYMLGNMVEVTVTLDEAAVSILDDMDAVGRPLFYALRAVVAAAAGDEAGWHAHMDAATQVTATSFDTVGVEYEMLAHIALARLRRDPRAQAAVFDQSGMLAGRLLRSQNIYAFHVDALAALGRAEEADRELARLRALPAPGFQPVYALLPWLEGRVHEAYGLTREALRSYRAAAAGEDDAMPGAVAQAAFDAGRLLLATGGSVSAARGYLRAAQRTFVSLGQGPAAAEATALLDASHRDRRRAPGEAPTGTMRASDPVEHLTPREREVAALAAAGGTNADIAAHLGVGVKAVAFHMGNILRKRGLTSRRQLRDPAARDAADVVTHPHWDTLSPRERDVAALLARELTDAEIADALALSVRTVGGHVGRVLRKLGVRSRRELRGHRQAGAARSERQDVDDSAR